MNGRSSPVAHETVAERVAAVVLFGRGDGKAGDVVGLARFEDLELDRRAERVERDRERRRAVLAPECCPHEILARVDANRVARDVGRREKREAHDVIPVQVRHHDVIRMLRTRAVAREHGVAEDAQPRTRVAEQKLGIARIDLHARRVSAERPADREGQLVRDERVDGRIVGEIAATRAHERRADLGAYGRRVERGRQRTARAPEVHPDGHASSRVSRCRPTRARAGRTFGSCRSTFSEDRRTRSAWAL